MKNINEKDQRYFRYEHPKYLYRNKNGSFSKGFLLGALIGGVLGILFAPEKGEDTRKKIKETAKDYEGKGKETLKKAEQELEKAKIKYEETAKKAEPVIEKAKEKIEEVKVKSEPYVEMAKEKASEAKEFIQENKNPVADTLEDLANEIIDEGKVAKKRYFKGTRKR